MLISVMHASALPLEGDEDYDDERYVLFGANSTWSRSRSIITQCPIDWGQGLADDSERNKFNIYLLAEYYQHDIAINLV